MSSRKTKPNAPCHCGSGKKYKKCCFLTAHRHTTRKIPIGSTGRYHGVLPNHLQENIAEQDLRRERDAAQQEALEAFADFLSPGSKTASLNSRQSKGSGPPIQIQATPSIKKKVKEVVAKQRQILELEKEIEAGKRVLPKELDCSKRKQDSLKVTSEQKGHEKEDDNKEYRKSISSEEREIAEIAKPIEYCEECYKDPKVSRGACSHKLQAIAVETSQEDGQSGGGNLTDIQLIEHASHCKNAQCSSSNCAKMKNYFQHIRICKIKARGDCKICMRLCPLLRIHAQKCKESGCPFPHCMAFREEMRQFQRFLRKESEIIEIAKQYANETFGKGQISLPPEQSQFISQMIISMQMYHSDEELQKSACVALFELTSTETSGILAELSEVDAIGSLLQAILKFQHNDDIRNKGGIVVFRVRDFEVANGVV